MTIRTVPYLNSIIVVLITIFCISCGGDANGPTRSNTPYGGDFAISSVVWDEYWNYNTDSLTDHRNFITGIFTDGEKPVDIRLFRNQYFSLSPYNTGSFNTTANDNDLYPENGIYNWIISNFLDSNIIINQKLISRLKVEYPSKTDSVGQLGFELKYSGSENIGQAQILISQAKSINKEMNIDDSADSELVPVSIVSVDNGSIQLDSASLAGLIPDRYYQYNLSHSKKDTIMYRGLVGILHSTASVSQYFYLSEQD